MVLLLGFLYVLMSPDAATTQTPLTPLASFTSSPNSLIQYPDGNFYGTSGDVSVLHSFAGGATDGAAPATLIEATNGNFYGITTRGVNGVCPATCRSSGGPEP